MQSTEHAPVDGGQDHSGPDDDLDMLRTAVGADVTALLDRYRFVGVPLEPDGATFAGLICSRPHIDDEDAVRPRQGGMVLIRVTTSSDSADPTILGKIHTTQETLTLAELVQHALEHERDEHEDDA